MTKTKPRSEERTQFLTDILVTAVEGGIGYWSFGEDYRYDGEPEGRGVTITEIDSDDGAVPLPMRVTLDLLATAVNKIVRGDETGSVNLRPIVAAASWANDTCPESGPEDIDATWAEQIFQVAMFGKVIYG